MTTSIATCWRSIVSPSAISSSRRLATSLPRASFLGALSRSRCPGITSCSLRRAIFYARSAVEAVKSLAPWLLGVLRRSESDEWVVRVTDLFQDRAEDGMFGHPTRDTFHLVAPICRFLYDDTHGCMVTRYGPFRKILKHMRIAVDIACLSHREIDTRSVNPRQCAYCTVGC